MGSSSKKKTTMAKRNRENAVRERRLRKQARKEARKQAAADLRNGVTSAPAADGNGAAPPAASTDEHDAVASPSADA
jgi:hypothetical protein